MNTILIDYAFFNEGGDNPSHHGEAKADTAVHAADILYSLNPTSWQVHRIESSGSRTNITTLVEHLLVHYITPCYEFDHDLTDFSAYTGYRTGS